MANMGPVGMFRRRRFPSPTPPPPQDPDETQFRAGMEDFQLPEMEDMEQIEEPDLQRPAFEAYQKHVGSMPDPSEFGPSTGRRILAALAGAFTGGSEGVNLAQTIVNDPHKRALGQWQTRGAGLKEASNMEEKGLQEKVSLYKEKVGARDRDLDRRVKQGEVGIKMQELKNNYEKMLREATSDEEANEIRREWQAIQQKVMNRNAATAERNAGSSALNARASMMNAETNKARPPKEPDVASPDHQMDAEFMATQYLANTLDNPEQFFEKGEDENGNEFWKVRRDLASSDAIPLARRIRETGQGILYKR